MSEVYVPLLSALGGAIIGSLASVGSVYVQGLLERKRQLTKLALEVAIQDQKTMIAQSGAGAKIYPLSIFAYFHWTLVNLIERNKLTPDALKELQAKLEEMLKVVDQASKK